MTAAVPDVCPARTAVFSVGAQLGTVYSRETDGTCTGRKASTSISYFEAGGPVDASVFPTIDVLEDDGPARLRVRVQLGSAGRRLDSGWFDSGRNEACRPTPFGDELRCMPAGGTGLSAYFADDRCTNPLRAEKASECPPRYTFGVDESQCPVHFQVYSVGAKHAGPVFTKRVDRSQDPPQELCEPRGPSPALNYVLYTTTRVPDDELPALEPIEPQ